MINSSYLSKKLGALGITTNDVLFVHSAFSAVGPVDGGSDAIIDAFLEAVGPGGTVIFPTFTSASESFSHENSKALTGILCEKFRHRPGAIRSLHPTHSVAAIGKQAHYFAGDKWVVDTTCGEGSMFMRLARSEAKIIMLGVDLNRCTLLHACEDKFDYIVPSFDITPPVNQQTITTINKFPIGHRMFIHLMEYMRNQPWFVQGYIGDARALVFPAKAMFDYCEKALKGNPYMFLCNNHSCNICTKIRKGTEANTGSCPDVNCEICVA